MKTSFCQLTVLWLLATTGVANAQFIIINSIGLFDPSFRGQANSTWFGWGSGSFDGATGDELIDNPSPTIGTTTSGVSLTQSTASDILSSGNNIYSAAAPATDLLVQVPTSGTPGSGFTTIIVQGRTAFGGYDIPPSLQPVSGINPVFAVGPNAAGSAQFWAKYEIPGNVAAYNLTIGLAEASFISIAELELDTYWSPTSYAADFATAVPEPSMVALLGVGALAGLALRRRSHKVR